MRVGGAGRPQIQGRPRAVEEIGEPGVALRPYRVAEFGRLDRERQADTLVLTYEGRTAGGTASSEPSGGAPLGADDARAALYVVVGEGGS